MSTPNAELAYKVLDLAKSHPTHFDMADWANGRIDLVDLAELTAAEVSCGTTACLAGWTVAHAGYKVDSEGRVYDENNVDIGHAEVVAALLLGIGSGQAGDLFYVDTDDINLVVAAIFGPRPEQVPKSW